MQRCLPITDVYAREILDSRGNPTVEVEVLAGESALGRASVPAGASTGKFEAVEIRDKEKRYQGKGVLQAVDNVNATIAPQITGMNVYGQAKLDAVLQKLDGTENKSVLGANATLGVSMAVAKAAAKSLGMPLYAYLGGVNAKCIPLPMMNILNGGRHASNTVDVQEFMIFPAGAGCFREGLQMCSEIYHALEAILKENRMHTGIGDEGGFAPDLADTKEALGYIMKAVRKAGCRPGKDVRLALDVAASELYDQAAGKYVFEGESRSKGHTVARSAEEMMDYYEELLEDFPIFSLEDPLDEEDWDGWAHLSAKLGTRVQLVGDDLFVTNTGRLKKGIGRKAANAILVKVNQIGTLTEAFDAIEMAKNAGYQAILSHRSGETADTTIADIAVAFNVGQIKAGAPCRGERVEKYNRLLRIEEQLGDVSKNFPCIPAFRMLSCL